MNVQQGEAADLFPAMTAEKCDQAMGRRDICPHRVRAAAAIMSEMTAPARGERLRWMLLFV